jgi:hypothetical protein
MPDPSRTGTTGPNLLTRALPKRAQPGPNLLTYDIMFVQRQRRTNDNSGSRGDNALGE